MDYNKLKRMIGRKYKQSLPFLKKTTKQLKKAGIATGKTLAKSGQQIAKDISKTKVVKQNVKTAQANVQAVKDLASRTGSAVASTASEVYKQSPVKVDQKVAKKIKKTVMKAGGSATDQAFSIYKSHVRPELAGLTDKASGFVGGIKKRFMGSYNKNKKR
tara:strand:+ start:296 stop:775 length:480 start_codon:yes stop_codon:yes gene_type:complete